MMLYVLHDLSKRCILYRLSNENVFSRTLLGLRHRRYATDRQKHSLIYTADLIKAESCKNIIVVAGAGISTPSGIPDFRSMNSGLYHNLQEYNLKNPTDIFDLYFFTRNPYPFFHLAKQLYPGNFTPNYVHYFLKLLADKKKLLRLYTQNIDSLESSAGVSLDYIVEAHGSFSTATCMKCKQKYSGDEIKSDIMTDIIPICKIDWCNGIIKPDIVFFGEDLPRRFFLCHEDLTKCELLLVFGTSLEVFPVAGLIYQVPKNVPRVLINKDVVAPFDGGLETRDTDAVYSGDVVEGVRELVELLEWSAEMDGLTSCQ